MPDARSLVRAFDRGEARGRLLTKYGRTQCPYGERRAEMRDAWLAGYDYGFQCASKERVAADA